MNKTVHGSLVRFRASEDLVAQAAAKAEQERMTLSEFMRHALRRELSAAA